MCDTVSTEPISLDPDGSNVCAIQAAPGIGPSPENVAVMVKRNSERAQFLQISLRKVTLKEADNIIGVTMQKKGISDLVMKVDLGGVPGTQVGVGNDMTEAVPEQAKGMG